MNEFLFIFRRDADYEASLTPEQLTEVSKPWQDWMGGLAAQNKLADFGNRLAIEGNVVKPGNVITNGPYVEIKEALGGYIVVMAASLDEATQLAFNCPILATGGNVEVRQIVPMKR